MSLTRRKFLSISGGAAAMGTLLLSGCGNRKHLKYLYATLTPEEEMKLGQETWYATGCRECPGGCGLLVRILEGRAKKIEGNPLHPVNRGKTCARAQSILQQLYNPDRYKGPLRRSGIRGSTSFDEVSWDQALDSIASKLNERVLFLSMSIRGHMKWLISDFMNRIGSNHIYSPEIFRSGRLQWSYHKTHGYNLLPHHDIGESDLIVSFGAPFLETWLSPVQFSRGYGIFRQGDSSSDQKKPRGRGTVIQIEPRLSMTAASADKWIPIHPGTEGILALTLTRLMTLPENIKSHLSSFTPTIASRRCGISEDSIMKIAGYLKRAKSPIVLCGGTAEGTTNGTFNIVAAHLLNRSLLKMGKNIPIRSNPLSPLSDLPRFAEMGDGAHLGSRYGTFQELELLGQEILSADESPIRTVFIYGLDPIRNLPESSIFRKAINKIPLIVSFSSHPNEVSHIADWILPDHTQLESWGDDIPDPAPGEPVLTLSQPVVVPRYNTRSTGDVLIELAKRAGKGFPWQTFQDLVQTDLRELYHLHSKESEGVSQEKFEQNLLSKGGWFKIPEISDGSVSDPVDGEKNTSSLSPDILEEREAEFDGNPLEFPFILIPYPSLLLDGDEGSNRPWLQEAGDPMTTIAWGCWVEVNPVIVSSLGLKEGDMVEVESPNGKMTLPVYPYPGIRPDVVAIPCGRGNKNSRRYAKDRSDNPLSILSSKSDGETGDFSWVSTRVQLRSTGKRGKIVKYEGTTRDLSHDEIPVTIPEDEDYG